jgi:hypothetical protein
MIDALPLHDATLKAVRLAWAEGRCVLELSSSEAPSCELIFTGVSELHVPRHYPWGRAVSINAVRRVKDNTFEVEVQSGDVLRIEASAWSFNAEATALPPNERIGNEGL